MREKQTDNEIVVERVPMHHREITLKDGRYMIFYTFDRSESDPVDRSLPPAEDIDV